MVLYEKKLKNTQLDEIPAMFFGGRYLILLMGAFSIFTGAIYNDVGSKSLHIFRSGWEYPANPDGLVTAERTGHTYAFGLDPNWHGALNALQFTNSYKMKQSSFVAPVESSADTCGRHSTRCNSCKLARPLAQPNSGSPHLSSC